MGDPINLLGVSNYGNALPQKQIESNFVAFFDWGFLEAGAFQNHTIPGSGFYGGTFHSLRQASDDGTQWRGSRQNWVWESGLAYSQYQPIGISGVYVNSVFYPNQDAGPSGYTVDYPNGTITFNAAQSGTVELNYSTKHIYVNTLEANPVYKSLVFNSNKTDSSGYGVRGSGQYDIPPENRVQLPALLVKCMPRDTQKGLQLGGGQIVYHPIHFYVVAENSNDLSQITDAVMNQAERVIKLFDNNKITYPTLSFEGNIAPTTICYPDMTASGTMYRKIRLKKSKRYMYNSEQNLYEAIVIIDSEMDMPEIT